MRRRKFCELLASAAACWPLAAQAQQPDRVRRIGVLYGTTSDDAPSRARHEVFLEAFRKLGWVDGRNVRIDVRWGEGNAERLDRHVIELVGLVPDAILVSGQAAEPLGKATRTVPIVFVIVPDPVAVGIVASLSRPGGNVTGFMTYEYSLSGKWPELLKEVAPIVKRVAVLRDPALTVGIGQFAVIQSVAALVGVETSPIDVRDPPEIRARRRGLCRLCEWRSDRHGEPVGGGTSRSDRGARGPIQTTRDLL
jgi:putative ABC transport system substrate-binding protein